jgi:hypothetical protein
MTSTPAVPARPWAARGRAFAVAAARGLRAYANWLVGISWKRFVLLALLLMVASGLLQQLPPFSWHVADPAPAGPRKAVKVGGDGKGGVEIAIDEGGVRVRTRPRAASAAASAAGAGASAASGLEIRLPPGLSPQAREAVREAVQEAKESIQEAIDEHQNDAVATASPAAAEDEADQPESVVQRTRRARWGDFLTNLAAFWVVASIILKITYKGRMQAEAQAARATEAAEAEVLKRQVVEARMAAMQAQVEPHFLFNTLASIDHLIETDPPRASRMQKNLIALLRASMPSLREAGATAARELGRELAVVRPYLEILKVRMDERLQTLIDVPEGLLSAEFPPMMLQSLVENAIRHGLEPKPEGGILTLRAQIVHGKLAVSVADTGMGFGKAATAGTGVGLANIRERLALLYGSKASVAVHENPGGGTIVTVTMPYRSLEAHAA